MLFKNGHLPLDVALIHVSPPDEHGFCSFGAEVGVTKTAAQSAKIVIAEVNPKMPRTLGDSFIHVSKIDHIVEVDYPLPSVTHGGRPPSCRCGSPQHVAALIPDGATLQTGIGAIPDAVIRQLTDRKHLGVHTELFSDGIIDLVERGVIDGEMKSLHPGKIIAGFMVGTHAAVRVRPRQPDHRDAPDRIRQRPVHRGAERPDGGHQLGHRSRPDRAGVRRQHRTEALQRRRRPGGHDLRRVTVERRAADHRAARRRPTSRGRPSARSCRCSSRAPAS